MGFYEDLVEKALPLARAKKIKRMCVGINYTMVDVERCGPGLAYTDLGEKKYCCEVGEELSFWKRPVDIVLKGYLSAHPVEVAVGLASINALLNNRKDVLSETVEGEILSEIPLGEKDEVLMVGYFASVFERLRGRVKKVWVFDKGFEDPGFGLREVASKAKLAIISASTLVNKSFDSVIEELEGVKEVILMGPSTPLVPEVFRFTPVTWLCGSVVLDAEGLFKRVCEGKGAPAFFKSKVLKKVSLRVKK